MSNYDISARDVASQAIEHFLQGGDSLVVVAVGNAWLFKEFTHLFRGMLAQCDTSSIMEQLTSDTSLWVQESRPFGVSRLFVIRAHESSPESFTGFSAGNELFMAVGDIPQNCLMALLSCATKSNGQLIHYTMPPLLKKPKMTVLSRGDAIRVSVDLANGPDRTAITPIPATGGNWPYPPAGLEWEIEN